MKQFFLAAFLIALPVGMFTAAQLYLLPRAIAADASLGDLSALKAIVTDTQAIAASGDLIKAGKRLTDFETAWDEAEATLRPMNKVAWGNVDDAADEALHALRKSPDPANAGKTLAALAAALDNPLGGAAAAGGVTRVAGIAVSDETGRPLACEDMIKSVAAAIGGGRISAANKAAAAELQSKAMERCNADDDAHADEFSAEALALAGN